MLNIKNIKTVALSTMGMLALSGCSLFCGPNMSDVKVMKPMAQKISDYIVTNGIPESLKDIPDLPYGLKGCRKEREEDYQKETCSMNPKNRLIQVTFFTYEHYVIDNIKYERADLKMRNNTTKTGMYSYFIKKNNVFEPERIKFYNGQTTGICAPMKQ